MNLSFFNPTELLTSLVGPKIQIDGKVVKIVKKIGQGGAASVSLVSLEDGSGRQAALKTVRLQAADRVSDAAAEARIWSALPRSEVIVPLLGSAEDRDDRGKLRHFLMPVYSGGSMQDALASLGRGGGRLSEAGLLRTLLSAARPLAILHSVTPSAIAHRDVKPENYLCASSRDPLDRRLWVLCDFGSATRDSVLIKTNPERMSAEADIERRTTMQFRAPEQVDLYSGDRIDHRVDCWALGCLLFKLAYLVGPFDDGFQLGILNVSYKVPRGFESTYSDVVDTLLKSLLVREPSARETAAGLVRRCAQLLGVTPPAEANLRIKYPSSVPEHERHQTSVSDAPDERKRNKSDKKKDKKKDKKDVKDVKVHATGATTHDLFDFGTATATAPPPTHDIIDFGDFVSPSAGTTGGHDDEDAFGEFVSAPAAEAADLFSFADVATFSPLAGAATPAAAAPAATTSSSSSPFGDLLSL